MSTTIEGAVTIPHGNGGKETLEAAIVAIDELLALPGDTVTMQQLMPLLARIMAGREQLARLEAEIRAEMARHGYAARTLNIDAIAILGAHLARGVKIPEPAAPQGTH
jgi:hypothetical protein